MTFLSRRFEEALVYANTIHASQTRKSTQIPYMSHLMGVVSLTLEHGGDENQAIAALLHDAVEDCGGEGRFKDICSRFGEDVATIVDHCTDSWVEPKPEWQMRKIAYIESIASKPERSLLVSLADKTHNAGAIISDLHDIGGEVWDRFNADKPRIIWYYRSLAEAFLPRLTKPLAIKLARHFEREVSEMERIAVA